MTPKKFAVPRTAKIIVSCALLAAGAATLSGCGGSGDAHAETVPPVALGPKGTTFWDVSRTPPSGSKVGDVLYAQQRTDAPAGAQGWTVIYVSEVRPGELKYVSGEIYFPTTAATAPRDVVLWNHETTGIADACAPSRRTVDAERVPALDSLLGKGYVVVMSDYPGQGLPGPSYYMAGQPNAKASLDMLRVAQKFPQANASRRYVMYGWSQGGQTTMWAESIAASYAPEFTGLGAALIAPAVRIRDLMVNSMKDTQLAGYVVSTLPGIKSYFPQLKYGEFLTTEGLEQFPAMAEGCFDVWSTASSVKAPYQPRAMAEGSAWLNALIEVDNFAPKGSMPFVIYQGSADTTTPVFLTQRERRALCAAGSRTEYLEYPGLDHVPVVPEAAKAFPAWAEARFKGQAAASNCPG